LPCDAWCDPPDPTAGPDRRERRTRPPNPTAPDPAPDPTAGPDRESFPEATTPPSPDTPPARARAAAGRGADAPFPSGGEAAGEERAGSG